MKFNGAPVDERRLLNMRDTMLHRGPDGEGVLIDGNVGLAHRRLSIVDLSTAGKQPMSNESGDIWLVFNGEIYNYVELRNDLRRAGHTFRSGTDSEVIVHLYEDLGDDCVRHLRGMFAFVIWDRRRDRILVARDRLGIKPCYFFVDDRQFVCASEIKAIVSDPDVPRAPDYQGLADFLYAGSPLRDRTMFQGIKQLLPGHTLVLEGRQPSTSQYWDLNYQAGSVDRPIGSVVGELHEILDESVKLHCRSDALLGTHLSGGLDSSTVASFAAKHVSSLKAFSIRFMDGGPFDETPWAAKVAQAIGAEWVTDLPGASSLAALYPALLWHMDQPPAGGGDAGFTYYAAAELASRHVKVALTGHGGDEVFAGYPAQFQTAFGSTEMFKPHSRALLGRERSSAFERLRRVVAAEGFMGLGKRLWGRLTDSPPEDPAALWTALHCGPVPERNPTLSDRFIKDLAGYSPAPDYIRPFREAPADDLLNRCLYHDLRVYLPQLLHKEDRASMAVSIESRVPLIDHHIVEYMAKLPIEQKIPDRQPKGLLRTAASPPLPVEVAQRTDKLPFAIPLHQWFESELAPLVERVVYDERTADRGIFRADLIRERRLSVSEQKNVLNVELWFRLFMDQDDEWIEPRSRIRNGS